MKELEKVTKVAAREVAGAPHEVLLVRDEIKLEDKAAKSEIVETADGVKLGVIEIPAFYRDFGAQAEGRDDFRSTTRDVRRLLAELGLTDASLLDAQAGRLSHIARNIIAGPHFFLPQKNLARPFRKGESRKASASAMYSRALTAFNSSRALPRQYFPAAGARRE